MKNLKFCFFIILLLWISVSLNSLSGQNVFWIDSAFNMPRLVKTGADSIELLSIPLTPGRV